MKPLTWIALALFGTGALAKIWVWWMRRGRIGIISGDTLLCASRVSMKVLIQGRSLRGFDVGVSRTKADMVISNDRFILATDRSTLLDISINQQAGKIGTVRSPGPERLIFEGKVAEARGNPSSYRIEAHVKSATEWADALVPFAEQVVCMGRSPAND